MSDKIEYINYFKNQDNWIGFFLMEAIGQKANEIFINTNYNATSIKAQLIINDVPCDLTKTLEYMGNVFDEMVEKRAKKIVRERADDLFFDQFNKVKELVKEFQDEVESKMEYMMRRD